MCNNGATKACVKNVASCFYERFFRKILSRASTRLRGSSIPEAPLELLILIGRYQNFPVGVQHRLVVPLLDKIIYRIYFNFTRIMPPRKSNSMENINIHLRGFKANGCSLSLSLSLSLSRSLARTLTHTPLIHSLPSNSSPSFSTLPLCPPPLLSPPPTQRADDLYRQNNNLISPQLGTIQNCTTKIINKFCADRSCRFQFATLATPYPPTAAHNGERNIFIGASFLLA